MMNIIKEKWSDIVSFVREKYNVTNVAYTVWLKPLIVSDQQVDGEVTILVPNDPPYAMEYVKTKFGNVLSEACREVTGEEICLNYGIYYFLDLDTEKYLRRLCRTDFDEIEECCETSGEETPEVITIKECYKKELCSTRERSIAISNESDDQRAETEENKKVSEPTYLQKWGGFTKRLYELMSKNRSLPVVIMSCLIFNYDDLLDCSVVNIRDHKTGKIREKVILIHNADRSTPEIMDDDLIKLPFS